MGELVLSVGELVMGELVALRELENFENALFDLKVDLKASCTNW